MLKIISVHKHNKTISKSSQFTEEKLGSFYSSYGGGGEGYWIITYCTNFNVLLSMKTSSNVSGLYVVAILNTGQTPVILTEGFCGLPLSLWANASSVSQIRPLPLPSSYWLIIVQMNAIQNELFATLLHKSQIDKKNM